MRKGQAPMARTGSEILEQIARSKGRAQDSYCDKLQIQIDVSANVDRGEIVCNYQVTVLDSKAVISTIGVAINYLEDGVNVPKVFGTARLEEARQNIQYSGSLIDGRADFSNDINGVIELGMFVLHEGTELLCLASKDFAFLGH